MSSTSSTTSFTAATVATTVTGSIQNSQNAGEQAQAWWNDFTTKTAAYMQTVQNCKNAFETYGLLLPEHYSALTKQYTALKDCIKATKIALPLFGEKALEKKIECLSHLNTLQNAFNKVGKAVIARLEDKANEKRISLLASVAAITAEQVSGLKNAMSDFANSTTSIRERHDELTLLLNRVAKIGIDTALPSEETALSAAADAQKYISEELQPTGKKLIAKMTKIFKHCKVPVFSDATSVKELYSTMNLAQQFRMASLFCKLSISVLSAAKHQKTIHELNDQCKKSVEKVRALLTSEEDFLRTFKGRVEEQETGLRRRLLAGENISSAETDILQSMKNRASIYETCHTSFMKVTAKILKFFPVSEE